MIYSICIKTNNEKFISDLLKSIEKINLDYIYLSKKFFKNYTNIIVHYKGQTQNLFYSKIAESITETIINSMEFNIIQKNINYNYFYFNEIEKKKILDITLNILNDNNPDFCNRKQILYISILEYIIYNKTLVIDGFINFRAKKYLLLLDEAVDYSVNKFLIEREYNEFVTILKSYINSKKAGVPLVHLIYTNQEALLLDAEKNIINIDNKAFESKYLSDISFCANDFALNTLLTLLPQKIYIHLGKNIEDEFISTLKLIFENRIYLCNSCNICNFYNDTKSIFLE